MTRPRLLDYDEVKRLYEEGESKAALARRFGVTPTAIRRAVDDDYRARDLARVSEWQRSGACVECGAPATNREGIRCRECAARAAATSVRPDTLQCQRCRKWKPDAAYPSNRTETARRERHSCCRSCSTEIKREYRARNLEKSRAYDREYKRRVRAAS